MSGTMIGTSMLGLASGHGMWSQQTSFTASARWYGHLTRSPAMGRKACMAGSSGDERSTAEDASAPMGKG